MATKQRTTVVGVFEDRREADRAVADLKAAGFRDDQIGVAMRHTEAAEGAKADDADDTHAGTGAVTGVLTGLGLGALAGLGVLSGLIPVIGPAIAGGTLGVILSNAALGAGVAGLTGALIGAGIPEEEAQYYHGEFEAGRTIVTVNANGRFDEAHAILQRHGAYDMSTRGAACATSSTAAGTATGTAVGGTTSTSRSATMREGGTIQAKEERLHAEKRPTETGEVRVRKEVKTETKHIEVPVQREEVVIERTPVHGRAATDAGACEIGEGEELRIPVRGEKVNISKDTVVTEEVKVGKRVVPETEHVTGQVRKEEIHVEQKGDVNVRDRGTGKGSK
jgi:uncharacterized protein (TIGR02271 family)